MGNIDEGLAVEEDMANFSFLEDKLTDADSFTKLSWLILQAHNFTKVLKKFQTVIKIYGSSLSVTESSSHASFL